MDLMTRTHIKNTLKVEVIGKPQSCGVYEYEGQIDRSLIDQYVADVLNPTQWQNPAAPDCGNNDGLLYVYLPHDQEIEQCELFIALDIATHTIYIS